MTSPQPTAQQQSAVAQQSAGQQRQVLLTLTALLAAGYTAQQLTPRATTLLAPLGVPSAAVAAAVRLATAAFPHHVGRPTAVRVAVSPSGRRSALAQAVSAEPGMRARYLLAAAERLSGALRAPGDLPPGERLRKALAAEQTYRQQHHDAQARRLVAAARVDQAAAVNGRVLGWYSRHDDKVTPDCAALDGTNFRADTKPVAGWPGALHGGTCRCLPGPAHATRRTADQVVAGLPDHRDEAGGAA